MKQFIAILLPLLLAIGLHAQDLVATLAGQAQVSGTNNGTGTNALFGDPAAIVTGPNGNFYVADSENDAIREVTTNGVVTTFAGQLDVPGTANATGTNAQFNAPSGLAFDTNGNLLVSDTGNNTIRKVTPAGAVSTFAGIPGSGGFANGSAGSALFSAPLGIAVAASGTIFVADSRNHCIREITNGIVSTFAGDPQVWGTADGTGTNAQFNGPLGLAFSPGGNLFVSDANNNTIREITPAGTVTTFAGLAGADGSADGNPGSARFRSPAEIVFDRIGNLFIADSFNQTIREISLNGTVTTVSGAVGITACTNGVNGQGRFYNPYGLAFGTDGSLVVADTYNELIRVVIVPFNITLQSSGESAIVKLSWSAVLGQIYQAQYETTPNSTWLNLGPPVTATNFVSSVADTSGGTPSQRFYRIILIPQ